MPYEPAVLATPFIRANLSPELDIITLHSTLPRGAMQAPRNSKGQVSVFSADFWIGRGQMTYLGPMSQQCCIAGATHKKRPFERSVVVEQTRPI